MRVRDRLKGVTDWNNTSVPTTRCIIQNAGGGSGGAAGPGRWLVAGLHCLLLDILLLQLVVGHSSLDGVLCQHCRRKVFNERLNTHMLEKKKKKQEFTRNEEKTYWSSEA